MTDPIINQVLQDSLPELRNLFEGTFGEEMESERMLEFMASVQMYAGMCMRTALMNNRKDENE
jgi:hypothetical protein